MASKTTLPDTTSTLFLYIDVTDGVFGVIDAYLVPVYTSIYDLGLLGIYTFTVDYSWGGPNTLSVTSTVTIVDSCITAVSIMNFAALTRQLMDADSTLLVSPTIDNLH